jgi:hypothetical protein
MPAGAGRVEKNGGVAPAGAVTALAALRVSAECDCDGSGQLLIGPAT